MLKRLLLTLFILAACLLLNQEAGANPPPVIWCPLPSGVMVPCTPSPLATPAPSPLPSPAHKTPSRQTLPVDLAQRYWEWLIFMK